MKRRLKPTKRLLRQRLHRYNRRLVPHDGSVIENKRSSVY